MRRRSGAVLTRPDVVGAAIVLALALVVYLSYTAQNGLPWQGTYDISVDVPNASEMTKNADVRIGGARVGQVLSIRAEPAAGGQPPFARLGVSLSRSSVGPLPVDTRTKIRLASLLGGKYLELTPGVSRMTVPDGGRIGLAGSTPIVDLDQAFRTFDATTSRGLRNVIGQLGDALAGRGTAINDALVSTRRLLPPLTRVLRTLVDPQTALSGLLTGAASATSALAPLAGSLGSLIDHGATTFGALDAARGALGQALEALPPTETVGTRTFADLQPVLADAAAVTVGLRPSAAVLGLAARRLDRIVRATTPVLARVPPLAGALERTFVAVSRYASDPAAIGSIADLRGRDFATFANSLFLGLGGVLNQAADAQLQCNALALWARNVSSALSDGDPTGSWQTFLQVVNAGQGMQVPAPSSDLHFNPYPREDTRACEAGNERYAQGQAIGHPAATNGNGVEQTSPPAGVAAAQARAGLLAGVAGGHP